MRVQTERLTILVDELKRGNERVFTDIYEMTQQNLHVYALMLMKDPDKTQDLLQDTYVKIYEKIQTLQDPSKFVPWAKRILYTEAMMEYRRMGKGPILVSEDNEAVFENIEDEEVSGLPEQNIDRAELQQIIFDVVKKLPAEQRVAMVAYYYDEMSVKEIAEMMGCSEGTVKSRLFNGRKVFKEKIEAYEKRHNVKLHGVTPLLFMGFSGFDEASAATAAQASKTLAAITAKTGMETGGSAMYAGAAQNAAQSVAPSAAKVATGVAGKKIAVGVLVAGLSLGSIGVGALVAQNSMDKSQSTEKQVAEEEPKTARERALKKYKEYLESHEDTYRGFEIKYLGEPVETLLCSETYSGEGINNVTIYQYYDDDRKIEKLGKIKSKSQGGKISYDDERRKLYALGFINGQDATAYEISGHDIIANGYYSEKTNNGWRTKSIHCQGKPDEMEDRGAQLVEETKDNPTKEKYDELKARYERGILRIKENNETERKQIN